MFKRRMALGAFLSGHWWPTTTCLLPVRTSHVLACFARECRRLRAFVALRNSEKAMAIFDKVTNQRHALFAKSAYLFLAEERGAPGSLAISSSYYLVHQTLRLEHSVSFPSVSSRTSDDATVASGLAKPLSAFPLHCLNRAVYPLLLFMFNF